MSTATQQTPGPPAPVNGNGRVFDVNVQSIYYGQFRAVRDTHLPVQKGTITAFIGPSGCGKSTVLRCLNRMNDLVRGFRFEGQVRFRGKDIYAPSVDPVAVRRYIGMVFQQPNPFAMSIYRNVSFGLRLNGYRGNLKEKVEQALRAAALWDEVKDKLHASGLSLSGGQQQRLCIARAVATEPEVLLMDEPCSALDPVATLKIEELIDELKHRYTIVIVTHNMQQAARVANTTAFMLSGELVEHAPTNDIFTNPKDERTEQYVTGKFG
jgi:phosphate transport system ATP-binding protein